MRRAVPVISPMSSCSAARRRSNASWRLRAFVGDWVVEDPVTGSLNAALAQWLIGAGRAPPRYVAAQGTALGRAGRVHVEQDSSGETWIGGESVTCVDGCVTL